MTPVIHCSVGNISLFPIGSLRPGREIQLRRFSGSERYSRVSSSSHQRLLLPQPALRLIGIYKRSWCSRLEPRTHVAAAVGTDVTIEEPNPAPSGEPADENSDSPPATAEASETAKAKAAPTSSTAKFGRMIRKSEMPPVKDEELVPDASFTGKVRSIKPFGIFVDFGAFTEGLVHISRASDGYIKDINSLFTVGQEVTVRIVEANKETGRISLTMRTAGDYSRPKREPSKDASGERSRAASATRSSPRPQTRKREEPKSPKFVQGQVLTGTVKNTTRAGAFVSLPDDEEGFLPREEEEEGLFGVEVGQEVKVKVLRIARGQVTLTMKQEQKDDVEGLNKELKREWFTASNAFQLAFRRNKEIATFLDEREKAKVLEAQAAAEAVVDSETDATISSDQLEDKESEASRPESLEVDSSTTTTEEPEDEKTVDDKLDEPSPTDSVAQDEGEVEHSPSTQAAAAVEEDAPKDEEVGEDLSASSLSAVASDIPASVDVEDNSTSIDTVRESTDASLEDMTSESGTVDAQDSLADSTSTDVPNKEDESPELHSTASVDEAAQEDKETEDSTAVTDNVDNQTIESDASLSEGAEISSNGAPDGTTAAAVSEAEDKRAEPEEPSAVEEVPVTNETKEADEAITDVASSQSEDEQTNGSVEKEPAVPAEKEAALNGANDAKVTAAGADQGSATKATISPALVKQLREETGAGMMDCKKALAESGGDLVRAQEFLRKKGLASADKKAGRATAEGRIGSYIHDNRIGVLIEVNCETDFVSRGDIFKELVDDLAMQVAACPQVKYLSTDDIPEEIVNKEEELEMQKEDLLSKPEQIRPKIVEGRVKKRLEEFVLLEQPFIKNDKITIKDWVKQTIATIGENMKVKRFVRYNLGEGLEKKSQDFAAEVAAQTAAKPPAVPKDDKPAETTETVEKKPTVAVSAALVKQLRDETGAGMMDCKKALSETGGDLEKAQEYLRKKGLSSADKKSSRLAAEGLISSYIHDSRIGCMIEVNSETDFVARNEKFKELANDLAMQVVACPQVEYVSVEDIPESVISKEKEIEMQREDLQSKPENIREKIVEGRIAKRLGVLALLEQPFIKDDSKTVKDLVKETIAALGENIKVRRFVRYTLGEN